MNDPKKEMTTEDELYRVGIVFLILGVVFVYVALKWVLPVLPEMECFFVKHFGLYCPGCGGTRAVIELVHGHFLKSLWYNPIVLYTVVIFGWFMLSQTLERISAFRKILPSCFRGMKFHEWHLYGALLLVVGNCFLKNILKLSFQITL